MMKIGMSRTVSVVVNESNTAAAVGSGDTRVFATPMMVALMENAAMTAAAAAFAWQPAGLNAHVAEFAAAAVVAGELRAVDQHRAAHAVLNGQKGDISRAG